MLLALAATAVVLGVATPAQAWKVGVEGCSGAGSCGGSYVDESDHSVTTYNQGGTATSGNACSNNQVIIIQHIVSDGDSCYTGNATSVGCSACQGLQAQPQSDGAASSGLDLRLLQGADLGGTPWWFAVVHADADDWTTIRIQPIRLDEVVIT